MSADILSPNPYDLDRMEHALGYQGPGVVRLRDTLDEQFQKELLTEINNPQLVHWIEAGDNYVNKRGVPVEQNHDTFALKVGGDYDPIYAVPRMAQLAVAAEVFIQSLSEQYPSLGNWQADEMSYHSYYGEQVGLSFHRDNMRFPGLIAIAVVDGEADFQVIDREEKTVEIDKETGEKRVTEWDWKSTYTIPTSPRDMILTRAPGLLHEMKGHHRPEHAVMNIRKFPRVTFMLRANNRPNDRNYGFTYYNWPSVRSSS